MRLHPTATGFVCLALSACMVGDPDAVGSSSDAPTFEEFEASVYREPWEGGVYIVNGDTPIVNRKQLEEFYNFLYHSDGALIVHRSGGADAKWNNTQKLDLRYCVSDNFGSRKARMVQAMSDATAMWEAAANVDFIYVSSQDSNCTASNSSVVFDVRPTSGAGYLARAFFPNQSRGSRNVIVDTSAFNEYWPLENVIAHELGHALGFRHEHTRPEAGTCYEDDSWRPLTPYDSASIMHYPQCNGSSNQLQMTATDRQGAAALYGAPGGGSGGGDGGGGDGGGGTPTGTPQTGSASASIGYRQVINYQPIGVVPGSRFTVTMTGSGDPDLYVRFGDRPTSSQFDCRPYLNGANEQCALDVPSNQTQAYIMVYGYRAGSYTITVEWTAP